MEWAHTISVWLAEVNFSSNKVTQLEPGNFFTKTTQKQKQTVRKVFNEEQGDKTSSCITMKHTGL